MRLVKRVLVVSAIFLAMVLMASADLAAETEEATPPSNIASGPENHRTSRPKVSQELMNIPADMLFRNTHSMPPVLFTHARHAIRVECDECHSPNKPALLPGASETFHMASMVMGRYCGRCHNGLDAFAVITDCTHCHQEKKPVILSPPPEAKKEVPPPPTPARRKLKERKERKKR